jgi:DNA-binding MarR family transcriptional regulator
VVRLTKTGHRLIEGTVRQLLDHEAGLIDSLSAAERATLVDLLARLERTLIVP